MIEIYSEGKSTIEIEILQKALNKILGTKEEDSSRAVVSEGIFIEFTQSKRKYKIDEDGNIVGPINKMDEVEEISNSIWEYNTETTAGKVTLTKYIGEATEIVIPSYYKVNGNLYGVEIGISANNQGPLNGGSIGNYKLKTVIFEDGVTIQNNDAKNIFQGNYNLTYVNAIPDGVTNLASGFYGCTSLNTMPILPDSVTNMQYTFYNCIALKQISELPENVSLLNYTFMFCNSLEEMPDIPLKVTSMNSIFANCLKINGTLIINSSNVKNIADAFEGTEKNIILKVPAESTTYTTCVASELPSNVTLETQDMDIEDFYINLTKTYGIVGKELDIYFNNIIYAKEDYVVNVICEYGQQTEEKWSYIPDETGEFEITIQLLQEGKVVSSKTNLIKIVDEQLSNSNISYLAIGDSTTAAGEYTQRLIDNFDKTNVSITLLGTQGSVPNLHEGRGGWSYATYQKPIYNTTVNPFYNNLTNKFDMKYYMNSNSYSKLNYVTIGLGINGLFACKSNITALQYINEMLEDLNIMIDSIHEYNKDIKIGVLVTIPPTEDETKFDNDYNGVQTLERYKINNILWCNELISQYSKRDDVYLIPTNETINCKTGFQNGVHPNESGYNEMGDTIYAWMVNMIK